MKLSRTEFAGLEVLEGREVPAMLWPSSMSDNLSDKMSEEPKGLQQIIVTPVKPVQTGVPAPVAGSPGGNGLPGFFNPSPWTPPLGGPRG